MDQVCIAGIGQVPVGEHWERSLRQLAVEAIRNARQDARQHGADLHPQGLFVGNVLAEGLSRQAHLGALLADFAGLTGIEAVSFESGGASGASALRQAFLAITSGMMETALVVGVEKFTDTTGTGVEEWLLTVTDSEYEAVHGLTPTAQAALLAGRYLHEYRLDADALAGFPLTAHANGAGNKNAMYRKAVSLESYQKSEPVCEPLNVFDIAPHVDGAAALLLTRRVNLPKSDTQVPICIAASAAASDSLALHDRPDLLAFEAARLSVESALQKAGIAREQVDLFEYFDAYSIYAALSLEAAGFAPRGQGWQLAASGDIALTGQIPCATLGGCKARGNPLGATGVYQAVEAVQQLRGEAGANQITGARVAMLQALAGPAALAVTHIFTRMD